MLSGPLIFLFLQEPKRSRQTVNFAKNKTSPFVFEPISKWLLLCSTEEEKKVIKFWLMIFLVNYPFKRNVNTCLCLTHNAFTLHLCIWQTLLSKATYIAFKLQFYILSALAFPGNRTHDLGVASAMLYHLSYRKAVDNMDYHVFLHCKHSMFWVWPRNSVILK